MNAQFSLLTLLVSVAVASAQPVHDDFVNRLLITGTNYAWTGDNIGATKEPGEPVIGNSLSAQGSLWWTWTAPFAAEVTMSAVAYPLPAVMSAFTGTTLSNLVEVPGNGYPSPISFSALSNQTYHFAVASVGDPGPLEFAINTVPTPSNDAFTNRTPLVRLTNFVSGTTAGATREPGEPWDGWSVGSHSVWYSWKAPLSGMARVEVQGDGDAEVYRGSVLTNLTHLDFLPTQYWGVFEVVGGTEYQIVVGTFSASDRGPFTLGLSLTPAAPNNDFAKRIRLTGTNNFLSAFAAGSTREPNENSGLQKSVWWSWTAPTDGILALKDLQAVYCPMSFGIYTGSTASNLTFLAGNSYAYWPPVNGASIRVVAGTEYQIALGTDNYCQSPMGARLEFSPSPANDAFANRIMLSGASGQRQGTTYAATTEPLEPSLNINPQNSVWYSWTAPSTGEADFSLTGTESTHWLSVYTNSTLATLGAVPTISGGAGSKRFPITAGVVYQIQIASPDAVQPFTLQWSAPLRPTNDDFANRAALTVSVSATGSLKDSTFEPNEERVPSYTGSIWWSWTPASNCFATIRVESTPGYPSMFVRSGTNLTNLVPVGNTDSQTSNVAVRFEADANVSYAMAVGALSLAGPENVRIEVTTQGPAPHDAFADRFPINGTFAGFNFGARRESDEPLHAGNPGRTTVWHSFIAASNGSITLTLSATNWKPVLVVYTGHALTNLAAVATNLYTVDATTSRATFNAVAGDEYAFAILGDAGKSGDYTLSLTHESPPSIEWLTSTNVIAAPGDDVSLEVAAQDDGTIVQVEFFEGGSLVGVSVNSPYILTRSNVAFGIYTLIAKATDNQGYATMTTPLTLRVPPPNDGWTNRIAFETEATGAVGSSAGAINRLTWWSWTATSNAFLTATAAVGSVPAVVVVYAITNSSGLSQVGGSSHGQATFAALSGTEYAIKVQAPPSAVTGAVHLTLIPAPDNDQFANRIALAGLTNIVTGNITAASREPGEPIHLSFAYPNSLWWRWTAPSNGTAVVYSDVNPSSSALVVYQGNSISNLFVVASNATATSVSGYVMRNKFAFSVVAGQSYEIAVAQGFPITNFLLHIEYMSPATNDMFADRTVWLGGTNIITGNNSAASYQAGEPGNFGAWWGQTGKTLWWSWIAPRTGVAILNTSGAFRHWVGVYTGSQVGSLNSVVSGSALIQTNLLLTIDAVSGVTYQIRFDGDQGQFGDFTLSLVQPGPPPNDHLANAIPLTDYPSNVVGSTLNATGQGYYNDPSYVRSIWWAWTAPETRSVSVVSSFQDPNNSSFSLFVNVFGGTPSEANLKARNQDGESPTFMAQAGATYYLQFSSYNQRLAPVTFNIVPNARPTIAFLSPPSGLSFTPGAPLSLSVNAADSDGTISNVFFTTLPDYRQRTLTNAPFVWNTNAPTTLGSYIVRVRATDNWGAVQFATSVVNVAQSHDLFANASALSGISALGFGNSIGTTREPGEPALGNTLWWEWTAPVSGMFSISTAGSLLDTLLYVFTGPTVSNLTLIASNDNAGFSGLASEVRLSTIAGTNYRIAVAGRTNAGGEIRLQIRPTPVNDDFADAAPIAGAPWTTAQSNAGASSEADEPFHSFAPGRRSLWWRWTAPESGAFIASTAGSDFDTALAIYTGDSFSNLVLIAASDDAGAERTSTALFTAVAGITYLIAVDSFEGSIGTARLTVARAGEPALFGPRAVAGAIEFEIFSTAGQAIELQSSTNLVAWTNADPITNSNGLMRIAVPNGTTPSQFFRLAAP